VEKSGLTRCAVGVDQVRSREASDNLSRYACKLIARFSGWHFEEITERQMKRAKGLLNRRPRKTLGYATPTEVFFGVSFGENFALQS